MNKTWIQRSMRWGVTGLTALLLGASAWAGPADLAVVLGDGLSAVALQTLGRQLGPAAVAGDWALAGLLVEPIQGYGGIVELPPGYLRAAAAKP